MSETEGHGKRAWEVFGWFGAAAVGTAFPVAVGWLSGSFAEVASYASDPERLWSLVAWSAAFLFAGFAVGLVVRHVAAMAQLTKKDTALDVARSELDSALERLSDRYAEIDRLEHSLRLAEANSETSLRDRGESLEDVRLRQQMLDVMSGMGSQERIVAYLEEKVHGGTTEDNERYGRAVRDLVRYGCLEGASVPDFANDGEMLLYTCPEQIRVLRSEYPSLWERRRVEIMEDVDEHITDALREFSGAIVRRSRS